MAELLPAREGQSIAWERRFHKIVLEVDSEAIIKLIKEADAETHPFGRFIEDCRQLFGMPWKSVITHTRRSGNGCADALARKRHTIPRRFQLWDEPLQDVVSLLKEDLL